MAQRDLNVTAAAEGTPRTADPQRPVGRPDERELEMIRSFVEPPLLARGTFVVGFLSALVVAAIAWAVVPAPLRGGLAWLGVPAGIALVLVVATTVRRRQEQARVVAERLRLLSTAFQAAANGIVITDPQGTALLVNPAFVDLTGYPQGEMIGQNMRLLKSGEQPVEVYQQLWTTIRAGNVWRGELVNRRRDGRTYTEEQTITPVRNAAGAITHYIGIKQDISGRKQIEQELRHLNELLDKEVEARTNQLAAANRDLELFAYAVSHDLRAPLRAIDFFGRELLSYCDGSLDETAREHLNRMLGGQRRMVQIIDAMMALFHLGRGELRPTNVDVSRMSADVIEELRRAHPGRVVEVTIQPGMQARADQRLLHAALSNLLGNAWKFTRKKSNPTIEVSATQQDGVAVFHVRDNGAGFNMAYADRLFTAIRRLHTQDEFEGNGIGLVSVHRVIQRHRGRIWVDAVEGEGATFHFTLSPAPVTAAKPGGPPAAVAPPSPPPAGAAGAPPAAPAPAPAAPARTDSERRLTELQLRALHFGQSLPSGSTENPPPPPGRPTP